MPFELCRHVKTNGRRCQSPSLRGEFWCYFHHALHSRHRITLKGKPVGTATPLQIPVLEDRESVQVAISVVAGAIASGHLDEKRAGALLRSISLALRNVGTLSSMRLSPEPEQIVSSFVSTLDGNDIAPRRMNDGSKLPADPDPSPAQAH